MAKAEYRSAIRSRKLINAALADLLQEKPLEKITVTEVVNRAGINRGTFYAHYTDIPDVVNHLVQQAFSAIQEALTEPSSSFAEAAHILMARIQSILEEDLPFFQKIMRSSAASLMMDQLVQVVLGYLLQNRASFPFGTQEQYEMVIRFCAGGISNLYRDWFAGKLPYTLDQLTQAMEDLALKIIGDLS